MVRDVDACHEGGAVADAARRRQKGKFSAGATRTV